MNGKIEIIIRPLAFILLATILCGIIFEIAGFSAILMFNSILDGAFLGSRSLEKSLRWALPLFITAVGVGISFRCGFFNIGAQGQFYMGSVCAVYVTEYMSGANAVIVIPLGMIAGMTGGALWSLWPGYLKIRYGVDEVITTLMSNFIAGLILVYVTSGPLKDQSGSGQQASTKILPSELRISDASGVSLTIILITIGVGITGWLLVNRTSFGTLSSLAGRNPTMLKYQGGKIWQLGLASFIISGMLAGLSGSIELFGPSGRVVSGFLPTHGFTAILVALVASYAVIGTAFSALFFGGLFSAAIFLPILTSLPTSAIDLFNAIIALLITARITLGKNFLRNRWGHSHD